MVLGFDSMDFINASSNEIIVYARIAVYITGWHGTNHVCLFCLQPLVLVPVLIFKLCMFLAYAYDETGCPSPGPASAPSHSIFLKDF